MKYRSLESLRGFAALTVAWYHSPFRNGGESLFLVNADLLVDFFFILSGFVLAHAYRARIEAGMPPLSFMALRLGRLWPLHLAVLAMWMPLVALTAFWGIRVDGLADLPLTALMLNSVGLVPLRWNYPSWSVSAEVIGGAVVFAAIVLMRRRLTPVVCLGLAVCCYAGVLYLAGLGSIRVSYDYGALRCLGGLFLGVGIQALGLRPFGGRRLASLVEIVAVVCVLSLLWRPAPGAGAELALIAGFGAMVAVFARGEGVLASLLSLRWPVALGTLSYSIYMLHALFFRVAEAVVVHYRLLPMHPLGVGDRLFYDTPWAVPLSMGVLGLVIACSALTWRWIEEPGRKASRDWVARRDSTASGPAVAASAGAP